MNSKRRLSWNETLARMNVTAASCLNSYIIIARLHGQQDPYQIQLYTKRPVSHTPNALCHTGMQHSTSSSTRLRRPSSLLVFADLTSHLSHWPSRETLCGIKNHTYTCMHIHMLRTVSTRVRYTYTEVMRADVPEIAVSIAEMFTGFDSTLSAPWAS